LVIEHLLLAPVVGAATLPFSGPSLLTPSQSARQLLDNFEASMPRLAAMVDGTFRVLILCILNTFLPSFYYSGWGRELDLLLIRSNTLTKLRKVNMKAKSFVLALILGTLAAVPAHAFPYWNNATYASRYRPAPQTPSPAKVQAAATAASPYKTQRSSELAVNERPWGPPKPYAVHSR
jgi:hypothetical protein